MYVCVYIYIYMYTYIYIYIYIHILRGTEGGARPPTYDVVLVVARGVLLKGIQCYHVICLFDIIMLYYPSKAP